MVATEADVLRDEQERNNLLRMVSNLETAMTNSAPGMRHILENARDNAMKRVVVLEKRIAEAKVEAQAEEQARITTAAALAAREAKLNEKEKETYRGLLQESYFTKRDFSKLEDFYAHSYDRLSESGRNEMSKRFWDSIRRGEYQFEDAPSIMQRKEAERAKNHLGLDKLDAKQLGGMSTDEQRAFADAYNSDDHAKAKQILARNSVSHSDDNLNAAKEDRPSIIDHHSSPLTDINLGTVDLKNVQLADATTVTTASIPDASAIRVNGR